MFFWNWFSLRVLSSIQFDIKQRLSLLPLLFLFNFPINFIKWFYKKLWPQPQPKIAAAVSKTKNSCKNAKLQYVLTMSTLINHNYVLSLSAHTLSSIEPAAHNYILAYIELEYGLCYKWKIQVFATLLIRHQWNVVPFFLPIRHFDTLLSILFTSCVLHIQSIHFQRTSRTDVYI